MKKIITIISLFFTLGAHAYEEYSKPTCSRDACLVSENNEMGFNSVMDQEGNSTLKVNTSASLLDIPSEDYCARGSKTELGLILFSLAGNTNREYTQGGHAQILNLKIEHDEDGVHAIVEYRSDYSTDDLKEVISFDKCN